MSLENTVASYEIQITRTGDGAAQATGDFNQVAAAAAAASSATKAVSAAANAGSEALGKMRETGLLARESLHGVETIAILTGGALSKDLIEGVTAARVGLMAVRSAAMLTGASLSAVIPIVGLIAAAAGTGLLIWNNYRNGLKLVEEQTKATAAAMQAMPGVVMQIENAQKAGLASPGQAQSWLQTLGRRQAPSPALRGGYMSLAFPGEENGDGGLPSESLGADFGAFGSMSPEALDQVKKQMQDLTGPEIEAIEKLRSLETELNNQKLDGFQKERAAAKQAYDEQIQQIQTLADIAGAKLPGGELAGAQAAAGAAYQTRLSGIDDQEHAKQAEEIVKQTEATITALQVQEGGKREVSAEEEYQIRMDGYERMLNGGLIDTQKYAELVLEAEKKKTDGILAEQNAAAQAVAQLAQEDNAATLQDIKQFEDQLTIKALQSKDDRVTIAKQEYEARIGFYQDLYGVGQLTEDQLTDYVDQATKKRLQAEQQAEKLHVMSIQEMEASVANNFATGFSQAFVSFVDGTKTAGQAFKDFATQVLAQMAEMIIQQEILNVLKSVLFGGGGTALAAGGGFYPTMAAGGVEGVSSVSSPTYFPRFNVIAGEAGREMLTVLARPRFMAFGGVEAVVGQAGRNTLAITNAAQLAAASGGGAGGHLHIEISHSDQSRADIIDQAVQGAEIRIVQRAQQNTPIRQAIKKAAA